MQLALRYGMCNPHGTRGTEGFDLRFIMLVRRRGSWLQIDPLVGPSSNMLVIAASRTVVARLARGSAPFGPLLIRHARHGKCCWNPLKSLFYFPLPHSLLTAFHLTHPPLDFHGATRTTAQFSCPKRSVTTQLSSYSRCRPCTNHRLTLPANGNRDITLPRPHAHEEKHAVLKQRATTSTDTNFNSAYRDHLPEVLKAAANSP